MQHHRGIWERLRRWRRRAQRGPLRAPAVLEAGPLEDRILYSASPVGSETVANATTSGDQKDPSVGVADNGDFVVVWEGDDSDKDGVYFQRFDSSGTAQGGETLANAEEKDDQKDPVVAVDADGDFVVVWQGNGPGDSKGVFLRRYDETGTALSGDVLVNTTTSGDQEEPAIAMASDGDFVVVWEGDDADKKGVYLQAFDSSGSRVGSETLVNVTTSGDQKDPRVGMADDDSFVVVWSGNGTGDSKGVFARAFNNVGGTLSGEVLVNTTTANDEKTPDVAVDTDGDFIVVWQGDDADKKGIFAQRYDSTGAAVGGETAINQTTSGDQKDPRVALDDDGDFVVVWRGNGTGDGDGVFARQYDSATGFEAEELVNTTTSGKQERPDVAITSDGDFIAVWEGDDADKNGVFFQRFENAAPVVDLNGAAAGGDHSASFVEDGGAVRIADTNATVVDTDDTNLASLTLSLAAIPDGSAETLDANVGGTSISKSYDSGTGVLTLSGSDTVANYQTVLRTVTYDNSSETPNTSDRTLQVVANDGSQDSAEVTTTISVVSTNDPPAVGSLEGGALAYTENNGAQNVTATAIVGDVDDTTLQSARITIAANFVSGEDVLAFTDTLNISGNYSSGTGVLTLTGSDTIAAYQAALRSITYENTSDNPSTATRTIDFLVNDGSSNSAVASRDIAITAENDNPDIKNLHGDSLSYNIGDGVVVVEQGGDAVVADPDSPNFDGGQLTVSIPTGGVFTEDSLSIRNQGSGMGQIGFAAGVVSYEGAPIGTATIGSTLTVNLNTSATPAALTALAQNVTYENTNAINPTGGARTLRLSLTDGNGGGSGDHDVTLNINVSNQAPVVTNFAGDTLMFAEGGSAAVIDQGDDATVTDADSIDFAGGNVTVSIITGGDPSEDVLSVRHVGNNVGEIGFAGGVVSYSGVAIGAATGGSGSNLVITLNGAATPVATTELLRNITYQNTDGDDPATTTRRVRLTVDDGDGAASSSADAYVQVSNANDNPTVTTSGGTTAYTENNAPTVIDGTVTVGDVDSGDFDGGDLAVSFAVGGTANDRLAIRDQGAGFGNVGVSGANVTFDFGGGPTVVGSFVGGTNGSTPLVVSFNPLATPFVAQQIARNVTYENVSEDPSAAPRTIQFVVDDGDGGASATAAQTVSVAPVNDAPVADDDSYGVTEGALLTVSTVNSVLVGDSDVDSGSITAVLSTAPSDASTFVLNADGSFSYDHDGSENTTDTFTYRAYDGSSYSNTATVTITVSPVNDAPVGVNDNVGAPAGGALIAAAPGVLGNDIDPDSPALTASLISGVSNGTLSFNADGSYTYTPDPMFQGVDSFTYQVSDGSLMSVATVTISVTGDVGGPEGPAEVPEEEEEAEEEEELQLPAEPDLPTEAIADAATARSALLRQQQVAPSSAERVVSSEPLQRVEDEGSFQFIASPATVARVNPAQSSSTAVAVSTRSQTPDLTGSALWQELDQFRHAVDGETGSLRLQVGAASLASAAFSIGYIFWALRSSYLMTTLLSAMPNWRMIDPLPILDSFDAKAPPTRRNSDRETLETIVEDAQSAEQLDADDEAAAKKNQRRTHDGSPPRRRKA